MPDETDQAARGRADSVAVRAIAFEHRQEALGIGVACPRLSWEVAAPVAAGWRQAAYALEALGHDGTARAATGKIASGESALVAWPFAPLASRERLGVRVRVWGADGSASDWSAPAPAEAGLLGVDDWSARFITPGWDEDTSVSQPCPLLRREFDVRPGVAQARLYITALGVFEAEINGAVVGDHLLDPGWTSYDHRLRYQAFDVTDMLRAGRNALGATLGEGWYRGRLTWESRRSLYGSRLALLAQLEIRYADGTAERVVSDESWRATRGPIRASSIYDGETYDARLEQPGWSQPGFDDRGWPGVRLLDRDLATLVAPAGPPVRRIEALAPVAIFSSPTGRTLLDFGQNLVGRLRISASGPAGQTITLRHAEVLEHGELGTRPLRSAEATDRYTLRGEGVETWEPRFTFHGFRYAEIDGWPGELRAEDVRALVCHSDIERTGWFECSDPLLNRLHENVVWSMRGNFFDIPTDCPQRDERLGWTGDIQVFAPSATFLYNCAGFLQSWLADLAAEQRELGGLVPVVVPNALEHPFAAAAWGDAAVIVPWVLYERFGDIEILRAQFASMRAWVDTVEAIAGARRLWDRGPQFGDWLDPSAPPERPGDARTDAALVATAYFARSAELVGRAAGLLGQPDDAARYLGLAAEVRAAFAREYVTPAGRVLNDAATAYALALQFGLLPEPAQRQHAAERLVALLRAGGYQISTGFVGTPLICDALCDAGQHRAACRLLMQRECPAWLYPVTMGATTIWERWDSLLPDGSVNPGEMTSFNHYALGAVADWLHRTVGGLAPAAPGYRQIAIAPRPGGGLSSARASHRTPYGLAECAWSIADGLITVTAVIPPNTSASVSLPGADGAPIEVGAGTHRWQYRYHDPDARPPLRLDSLVGEFIDDAGAWAMLADALAGQRSSFIRSALPRQSNLALREALARLPNAGQVLAALEQALAAR